MRGGEARIASGMRTNAGMLRRELRRERKILEYTDVRIIIDSSGDAKMRIKID